MRIKVGAVALFGVALALLGPELAYATVQSSLETLQHQILGTFMPLLSVIALLFAGLAYLTGSPNSRSYLIAAIIGAAIGFGAESIVGLIRSIVN
jgi:type IV secretory pathway VirB2 component (pilin)